MHQAAGLAGSGEDSGKYLWFLDTQLHCCLPEMTPLSSCSAVDGKDFLEHEASRMCDISIKYGVEVKHTQQIVSDDMVL